MTLQRSSVQQIAGNEQRKEEGQSSIDEQRFLFSRHTVGAETIACAAHKGEDTISMTPVARKPLGRARLGSG